MHVRLLGAQIEIDSGFRREHVVHDLRRAPASSMLVLDTCQRLECFGANVPRLDAIRVTRSWEDVGAFERLARIAAGLESRVLGELEILGQVRAAYKRFSGRREDADVALDRVFQDALALARKTRRTSGIDRNLTSLSGLAGREILNRIPSSAPVAVVGSGSLAGSVARYFRKRGDSPIRISSLCHDHAMSLAAKVGGFGAGIDHLAPLLKDVAGIVTATAAPHPVVYPHHLAAAHRPLLIIDLGEPPDCQHEVPALPDIHYVGLREMEGKANFNADDRRARSGVAARILHQGALAWGRRSFPDVSRFTKARGHNGTPDRL
jgi:glutamyl-tRNA reductase